MELDHSQRKQTRISNGNGRFITASLDQLLVPNKKMDEKYHDDNTKDPTASSTDLTGGAIGRFYGGWPTSRIVRVSRATGGKDRHSKVLTSKGLRDRRVRLSVNTAIQFYDLQDRLGFDQPSKAVEWLLKAAASSITELPPMNTSLLFPDTPTKDVSDEKIIIRSNETEMNQNNSSYIQHQKNVTTTAACSSTTSETTSKGSGLSLARSDQTGSRCVVKSGKRAKVEKKEKLSDGNNEESSINVSCLNFNPISQTTSFTELLSSGFHNATRPTTTTTHQQNPNFVLKSPRQWSSNTMDYFTSNGGLLGHHHQPVSSTTTRPEHMHFSTHSNTELQQFSFAPDNLIATSNNNNLNFSISTSCGIGAPEFMNRGTLQSNSSSSSASSPSSMLPHLQRFSSVVEGSNSQGFYIGTAAGPVENHHHQYQFLSGYDAGRLQLFYGDAHDNKEDKGKH